MLGTSLSDVELAMGWLPGRQKGLPPTARSLELSPIDVLRQLLRPLVQENPCLVSFSGGVDSSVVLAVAAEVAREQGVPLPVPVTRVFPGQPETYEDEWQTQVLSHLGITEQQRLPYAGGELDFVGPHVRPLLRTHGLVFPASTFTHGSLYRLASGGVLLTGEGGDEVMGPRRITQAVSVARALRHRRRVPAAALRSALLQLSRGAARTASHDYYRTVPWLRPGAREAMEKLAWDEDKGVPLHPGRATAWLLGRRAVVTGLRTMDSFAATLGTRMVHPLLEPDFVHAIARWMTPLRAQGRHYAAPLLFADLLPERVLGRRTKAAFTHVYRSPVARSFAEQWEGQGVPGHLVDWQLLRSDWIMGEDRGSSELLLQSAWLASQPS